MPTGRSSPVTWKVFELYQRNCGRQLWVWSRGKSTVYFKCVCWLLVYIHVYAPYCKLRSLTWPVISSILKHRFDPFLLCQVHRYRNTHSEVLHAHVVLCKWVWYPHFWWNWVNGKLTGSDSKLVYGSCFFQTTSSWNAWSVKAYLHVVSQTCWQ